jgi:hypothetical protein
MSKELTPMQQFIEYLKSELIGISEWDDTKKFLQSESNFIRKKEREAVSKALQFQGISNTYVSAYLNENYPL